MPRVYDPNGYYVQGCTCDYCNYCTEISNQGNAYSYTGTASSIQYDASQLRTFQQPQPQYEARIAQAYFKPSPVFHGKGPLFLGPELELEVPRYNREGAAKIAFEGLGDLVYLKDDSSINYGFELVTHPMDYDWLSTNFRWEVLDELVRFGCQSKSNNGLHVHLSRAGFSSKCHVYRWMRFIYRNEEQVSTIARRRHSDYARYHRNDNIVHIKHVKGMPADQWIDNEHDTWPERYSAINIKPPDTFELRIFASSLVPQEVMAAFELAAGSVEYTRNINSFDISHNNAWDWPLFVTWLKDSPYTSLQKEITKRCA
jgi:Putative amidoligase enzyme